MSDGDHILGQPTAEGERSLFDAIMGDEPVGVPDGGQEQGQDGGEPERREAEPPQRERDERGQFAKREEGRGDAHRVPVGALKDERGKRQAAESERDTIAREREAERRERETDRREMAELRRRLEMAERGQGQPQAQQRQAEPEAEPDMYTQPQEWRAWMIRQATAEATRGFEARDAQRIAISFEDASGRHGDAFRDAYRTLDGLPPDAANLAVVARIKAAPDPGEALVNWHKAHQARAEIGADPVAYRDRVRSEIADPQKLMQDPAFRQAALDLLRAEAGQGGPNGGPRATYTGIPSLNGARGGNARAEQPDAWDNSDRGVFRAAMDGPRRG